MSSINCGNLSISRRELLCLVGTGVGATLAGCAGEGDTSEPEVDGEWEPTETIRWIIPFEEGGGTDVYARGVVEALSDAVGQPIQVDNVPGGGGLLGFAELLRAQPDGHTILGSATPLEVAPQMLEDPGFDQRDSAGISVFGESAWCLIVNEEYEGEVEEFEDVIEKHNSGEWNTIAIQEPGSSQDIIVLLAKYQFEEYDWQWENRVRYAGTGPVTESVASGEVPCGIGTDAGTRSAVDAGDVYPVASFLSSGTSVYPDIPSVTDLDYPELDFVGGLSRGLYAPPETPDEIREFLSEAMAEAIEDDRAQTWSDETGNPVSHEGPDAADAVLDESFASYEEFDVVELIEEHDD